MQITKNVVASLEYTLTDGSGNVIDSSTGREPLVYLHGNGMLIPGLEQELEGKSTGDSFHAVIPPQLAYGDRDPSLLHQISRKQLPADAKIEVGMQFQAKGPNGAFLVMVVGIDGDRVALDANHPLAGVTLHFDVKVVDTRAATAEELSHGHIHGPGGHQH